MIFPSFLGGVRVVVIVMVGEQTNKSKNGSERAREASPY